LVIHRVRPVPTVLTHLGPPCRRQTSASYARSQVLSGLLPHRRKQTPPRFMTKSHQSPRNFGLAREVWSITVAAITSGSLPIPAERGRLIRLLEEKHDHARAANEQADRGGSSASRAAPPGGPMLSSLSRRLNVWRSCVCHADFPLQTRGSIEDLIMPAPGTVACSLAIKHTYGSWWRCLRQDGTRYRGRWARA
jgi:hypothetical protein